MATRGRGTSSWPSLFAGSARGPGPDVPTKVRNSFWPEPQFTQDMRRCRLNSAPDARHQYTSNVLTTAKYEPRAMFLPWVLWEQFRRIGNLYFVLISALQARQADAQRARQADAQRAGCPYCEIAALLLTRACSVRQVFTDLSPTGSYTTLAPLVFVVSLSVLREAVEESRRKKADTLVNQQPCRVMRGGSVVQSRWRDLVVGDNVQVLQLALAGIRPCHEDHHVHAARLCWPRRAPTCQRPVLRLAGRCRTARKYLPTWCCSPAAGSVRSFDLLTAN